MTVERADLITVIQQRNTAETHHHAVQEQDQIDAALDRILVATLYRALKAGEGRERTGNTGVAGFVIDTKWLAA